MVIRHYITMGTKWGIHDLDSLPNGIQHPAQIDNRVESTLSQLNLY